MSITLQRIRRGTTNVAANATTHAVPIIPALSNLTKSMLVYTIEQATSDNFYRGVVALLSENTLTFEGTVDGTGQGAIGVAYTIFEFTSDSSISIYHPAESIKTAGASVPVPGGISVSPGKTLVLGNVAGEADAFYLMHTSVLLTSPTTVKLNDLQISNTNAIGSFQVVEFFDRSSVVTGNVSSWSGLIEKQVTISEVNPNWVIPVVGAGLNSQSQAGIDFSAFVPESRKLVIRRRSGLGSPTCTYQLAHTQWIRSSNVSTFISDGSYSVALTPSNISSFAIVGMHNPSQAHFSSHSAQPGDALKDHSGGLVRARTVESTGQVLLTRDSNESLCEVQFYALNPGFENPDLVDEVEIIDVDQRVTDFPDEISQRSFSYNFEFTQLGTLCELTSRATQRLGDRFDIPQSVASFWANQAYLEVCNLAQHDTLETIRYSSFTTGSPLRLRLPNDYNEPITLSRISWGSQGADLTGTGVPASRTTLERIGPMDLAGLSASSGEPKKYSLNDRVVEVWPTPDSDYSLELRYKEYPSPLTFCSNALRLSPPWRMAVLFRTVQRLAEYVGDDERAAREQNQYVGYVQSLDTDLGKRQKEKGRQEIRVAGYHTPRRRRGGKRSDPDFDKR